MATSAGRAPFTTMTPSRPASLRPLTPGCPVGSPPDVARRPSRGRGGGGGAPRPVHARHGTVRLPLGRDGVERRCRRAAAAGVIVAGGGSFTARCERGGRASVAARCRGGSEGDGAAAAAAAAAEVVVGRKNPGRNDHTTRRRNGRGDNAERDAWARAVVAEHSGGRVTKRAFAAHLGKLTDPPAALEDVCVVVVGTKKPGNIGAIARACGSFECEDLRLVAPRGDPYTRASLSAAKGAQHIVYAAGVYDTLADALSDCAAAVAFHRWCDGLEPRAVRDVAELLRLFPGGRADLAEDEEDEEAAAAARVESEDVNTAPAREGKATGDGGKGASVDEDHAADANSNPNTWRRRPAYAWRPVNQDGRGRGKLALVFGREVEGLFEDEVNACDAVCSIPTGRLVESLSVSHAAVIILSQYFQHRSIDHRGCASSDDVAETQPPGVLPT